jgi:hypothetical protein
MTIQAHIFSNTLSTGANRERHLYLVRCLGDLEDEASSSTGAEEITTFMIPKRKPEGIAAPCLLPTVGLDTSRIFTLLWIQENQHGIESQVTTKSPLGSAVLPSIYELTSSFCHHIHKSLIEAPIPRRVMKDKSHSMRASSKLPSA